MYILECSDGSYYTGSTNNLEIRLDQHQAGEAANHTKKRLPVKLVYHEEFDRIDDAFYREKQVQGWSRKKKEALINGQHYKLPELSKSHSPVASTGSATEQEFLPVASTSSATEQKSPFGKTLEAQSFSGGWACRNHHRPKTQSPPVAELVEATAADKIPVLDMRSPINQ